MLQSSSWGWITPRVPDGPDATPSLAGVSLSAWFIVGGFLVLWLLITWLHHQTKRGKSPLFDPDWEKHGYMEQAANLIADWCRAQPVAGMKVEVRRLPGLTPVVLVDVPGEVQDCAADDGIKRRGVERRLFDRLDAEIAGRDVWRDVGREAAC